MHLKFSKTFDLFAQEAHLTKNALLSSFDLLLKANFYQDRDGFFYSAFFHLTIGLERMMKLAVVSDHMLQNNYSPPSDKYVRSFSHNLAELYQKMLALQLRYLGRSAIPPPDGSADHALINFLSRFGTRTRYFNLDEILKSSNEASPLDEWLAISDSIYREHVPGHRRHRASMHLFQVMDKHGIYNGFTPHLNLDGHPMTVYDLWHRQLVIEKSRPLVVWRIIELFYPIHALLTGMSLAASEYEVDHKIEKMVIPHYEDFFYFFNATKESCLKRKRWLDLFHA